MRKLLTGLVGLAVLGAAIFYFLTMPETYDDALPAHTASAEAGALVFNAGGCASCHAVPKAEGEARLVLTGGLELKTPFGTFVAPNISPHPEAGIGSWNETEFLSAMLYGTSPEGQHYYPSFPYTSYARMSEADLLDLFAYLQTLPQNDNDPGGHDLGFPFNIRRGLGLWKALNLSDAPVMSVPADPVLARGQYLVEGPGHCGECHTPRDALSGSPKLDRWLAGGPNPEGEGKIPNITPHESGLGGWAEGDIVYYLATGFTPEFDSAGGQMASVVRNISLLPESDQQAIAAYLKSVPAVAATE